uniref:Uncharacterized protein n=1 Tax=viral metagenome TaxID=1070528 RepID=A0A6M3IDZ9_9ZZZZ
MALSGTHRTLAALIDDASGLLKDNVAGDISAQDLRDAVRTSFGAHYLAVTPETGNFTAVPGSHHLCDVATTGSIVVSAPGTPVAGDRFRVTMYSDSLAADRSVSFNSVTIRGASSSGADKWSLWIEGESLELQYIDGTYGWEIVYDGRIPHCGQMYLSTTTTGTYLTANVFKIIPYDTEAVDNADIVDVTDKRFELKRVSTYLGEAAAAAGVSDQQQLTIKITDGTDSFAWTYMQSAMNSQNQASAGASLFNVNAARLNIEAYLRVSENCEIVGSAVWATHFSMTEVLR